MRVKKFTNRNVEAVEVPTSGVVWVSEETIPGFYMIVRPNGHREFHVEYGPRGKRRRMKLGIYGGDLESAEDAREAAKAALAAVRLGRDPLEERKHRRDMPTFRKYAEERLAGELGRRKSARMIRTYLRKAEEFFGSKALDAVTVADVRRGFEKMREKGKNATANRWRTAVAALFAAALRERPPLVLFNPAADVEPVDENPPRARTLNEEETARVREAVDAIRNPWAKTALHLLLATGARKSEVLKARWEDIDLAGGRWRIPSPKAGKPQWAVLPKVAVERLTALERVAGSPWVFPGAKAGKPLADLRRHWGAIRKAAKVDDVTIHDIRRSVCASIARDFGIPIASRLMRHSNLTVTQRHYAPIDEAQQRDALEAVSAKILNFQPKAAEKKREAR